MLFIFPICLVAFNHNVYHGYDKSSWANNVRVLGLLSAISLLLFGYACQIGIEDNRKLGPLLCLNLVFILFWLYSLTCITSFILTCITSWIIFILTLTIIILLGHTKNKLLPFVGLPFLWISLFGLFISCDIILNNPENPEHVC